MQLRAPNSWTWTSPWPTRRGYLGEHHLSSAAGLCQGETRCAGGSWFPTLSSSSKPPRPELSPAEPAPVTTVGGGCGRQPSREELAARPEFLVSLSTHHCARCRIESVTECGPSAPAPACRLGSSRCPRGRRHPRLRPFPRQVSTTTRGSRSGKRRRPLAGPCHAGSPLVLPPPVPGVAAVATGPRFLMMRPKGTTSVRSLLPPVTSSAAFALGPACPPWPRRSLFQQRFSG